jgi:hypothetical protein
MSAGFLELLIIAVVSLSITFVLFRWLESRAEAESPLLGGTIKYGGALGGFVLIFWLLTYIHANNYSGRERTDISLAGEYDIQQIRSDGQTRKGSATIRQREGNPELDIDGEIESKQDPPSLSFHTELGVLKGRRLVWLYENERREMGIALGDIRSPDRILLTYGDVLGSDLNADIQGRLIFTKREEP